MSRMSPEFDKIDEILVSKGKDKLSDNEKQLIENSWRNGYLRWNMSPKGTDHEFALNNQLVALFSNIVHDVLLHTRKKN